MGNLWIFPLSFTVNLKLLKKVYLTFETNVKQFPNVIKTKIPMIPKFHWFPKWKNIKKTITMYTLIKLPKTNGIWTTVFFKKRKKLNACRERRFRAAILSEAMRKKQCDDIFKVLKTTTKIPVNLKSYMQWNFHKKWMWNGDIFS